MSHSPKNTEHEAKTRSPGGLRAWGIYGETKCGRYGNGVASISTRVWLDIFSGWKWIILPEAFFGGSSNLTLSPGSRYEFFGDVGFNPSSGISLIHATVLALLSAVVQAVFLALMVDTIGSITPGGPTWSLGALVGFIFWLGFVAPASLTNKLSAGPLKARVLETGNHLLDYVLMGAIPGAWRQFPNTLTLAAFELPQQ